MFASCEREMAMQAEIALQEVIDHFDDDEYLHKVAMDNSIAYWNASVFVDERISQAFSFLECFNKEIPCQKPEKNRVQYILDGIRQWKTEPAKHLKVKP